jgi:hypothetical protein
MNRKISTEIPYDSNAFGAYFIVTLFGFLGGYLVKFLHGFKFPKIGCFPGFTIKPLIRGFEIPSLLGMILFGFIARNFFGDIMEYYPS